MDSSKPPFGGNIPAPPPPPPLPGQPGADKNPSKKAQQQPQIPRKPAASPTKLIQQRAAQSFDPSISISKEIPEEKQADFQQLQENRQMILQAQRMLHSYGWMRDNLTNLLKALEDSSFAEDNNLEINLALGDKIVCLTPRNGNIPLNQSPHAESIKMVMGALQQLAEQMPAEESLKQMTKSTQELMDQNSTAMKKMGVKTSNTVLKDMVKKHTRIIVDMSGDKIILKGLPDGKIPLSATKRNRKLAEELNNVQLVTAPVQPQQNQETAKTETETETEELIPLPPKNWRDRYKATAEEPAAQTQKNQGDVQKPAINRQNQPPEPTPAPVQQQQPAPPSEAEPQVLFDSSQQLPAAVVSQIQPQHEPAPASKQTPPVPLPRKQRPAMPPPPDPATYKKKPYPGSDKSL